MSTKPDLQQQAEDADFLVEHFGVPTPAAADLVAREGVKAHEVEQAARAIDRARDPLAGVPVPAEPGDDIVEDNDEVRLKPVVRHNNHRGAG